MSDQNIPLHLYSIYEPRVNINDKMVQGQYAIVKGGSILTMYNYTSNSSSNAGINWSPNPPGTETIMSRLVSMDVQVTLDFAGDGTLGGTEAMIQSNLDAPRAFPLESIIKNFIVTVNGFDINVNSSQIVHPFSRYYLNIKRLNEGVTPNMLDVFQKYSDGDGNNRNPLAWFDNSSQNPRGSYYDYDITNNTNTAATVVLHLKTYLMVAPFEWLSAADNDFPGLCKLDTLDFNVSFIPNLSRVWSRSEAHPVPVTSVDVTIGENSILNVLWITPREEIKEKIRRMPELKYPFYRTVRYDTRNAVNDTVAPNTAVTLTSATLNLSSIPRAIYVYMIENESAYTAAVASMTTPDVYFAPDNITITWNNEANVLNTFRPQQLYDLCVKNNLSNTTYTEFRGLTNEFNQLALDEDTPVGKIGLCSAPVRIIPSEDFPLNADEASGSQGKWNLQVQMTAYNRNQTRSISPQLCVLVVYEGYLSIANARCFGYEGPLSPRDVLLTPVDESISWHDLNANFGGARLGDRFRLFGRQLKSGAEKANKFLKDTKAISRGLNAASKIPTRASSALAKGSQVADYYGYGGCDDYDGGMLDEHYGGRKLTQKEMKKRLRCK
jgi:hypothetical protein